MRKCIYFAILLTILLTIGFAEVATKSENKRLISVSASDYIEALPDTAYFNFTYTLEKESPEEAGKIGEQIKRNVREVFSRNQIAKEDILVDAAAFSERYDWDNKKAFHNYTYTSRIRLTDFSKIAQLRKELINENTFAPAKEEWFARRGLSVNQNVSYEIVTKRNELEKNALKKAYEKALLKIKGIGEVSNFKYIIYKITESGFADIQPMYRSANFALKEAAPAQNDTDNETLPTLQRLNSVVTVEAEIL